MKNGKLKRFNILKKVRKYLKDRIYKDVHGFVNEFKFKEKTMSVYRIYSEYLKEKYGEKVYKLPINLPITCPNRDGKIGTGGCIFCGECGAGFESLDSGLSVEQQLERNMEYIGSRYGAKKFIAFFQNFTNTYMPAQRLREYVRQAAAANVVEVCISTRPDCVSEEHLKVLKEFKEETGVEVSVELGLQTANYRTLEIINRGHGLAEFIDAALRIKNMGFPICVHIIADLPWDTDADVRETARILTALGVEGVKLHSLYIVKGTPLAEMYERGEITLCTKEDYVRRVVIFLKNLGPEIAIERIIGRAPEKDTITANFNTGWWKIKEEIEQRMEKEHHIQGDSAKMGIL